MLHLLHDWPFISIAIGLFIGLILALTGAGGSILAIPLLMLGLNLNVHQAAPIALLAVMLAAVMGTIQGLRQNLVRYRTALLMAAFGVVFAPLGVWIASFTPHAILRFTLASVLLYIAWQMWRQSTISEQENSQSPNKPCMTNQLTSQLYWTAPCTKRLIATGMLTGFTSGLLGVGGGFLIVPILRKISNFSVKTIVATTLMSVALVSAVSIYSYSLSTPIQWKIATPFVLSTMAGLYIFSQFSHKVSTKLSQRSFAVLAIIATFLVIFER